MKSLFYLICFLLKTNCSFINYPAHIYKKIYNDKIIKIYEPENMKKKHLKSLLFFTGANSLIPADLYNNFINSLVDYNYSISVLPNDLQASYEYIKDIENEYSSIIPLAHSSGCVNAINLANNFKTIEKSIFLDPVDNSNLVNKFNKIQKDNLLYLKDLLIITAEKSYKWSLDPFTIPFIPAFRLNIKELLKLKSDLNIEYIESEEHGHCDILDPFWSDQMHLTISKGVENREYKNLQIYHTWLAQQIHNFIFRDENENNYTPCDYEDHSEDSY
tara:strand:- start:2298 stop:3119 length:822 start_codon:yes stop_codon:yes gene_type:complete